MAAAQLYSASELQDPTTHITQLLSWQHTQHICPLLFLEAKSRGDARTRTRSATLYTNSSSRSLLRFTSRAVRRATRSSAPSQFLESFPSRRRPSRRSSTKGPTRSTTPTPTFPGGSTSGRRCVRSQAKPSACQCLLMRICSTLFFQVFYPKDSFNNPLVLDLIFKQVTRVCTWKRWWWGDEETSINSFYMSCHRPDLIFFVLRRQQRLCDFRH